MFRNYLTTALRNLARNRLYAAITILGLAVAFAVAILAGQYVRGEFTYDHWIPGHERIYQVEDVAEFPGQKPVTDDEAPIGLAGRLRAAFPGAEAIARLMIVGPPMRRSPAEPGATEWSFAWVDPDFFKVFPLPVLAGDPVAAMRQPDTVVLTRRMARKYFGRDLPIGETLEVEERDARYHRVRVGAVLEDLPGNTNFRTEVFGSGRTAWSSLTYFDTHPAPGNSPLGVVTFVRLSSQAAPADLLRAVQAAGRSEVDAFLRRGGATRMSFFIAPRDEAHWAPQSGPTTPSSRPSGDRSIIGAIAAVAALIVLVAAINFVTLMTARAARRGVEVGVRKATGATRRDLVIQFMGEALIQVAVSVAVAAALAEVLVRPFGALVQRDLRIDFVHDPLLLACAAGFALLAGALASVYPALVLSSFRPAAVLKGGVVRASGSPLARSGLVAVQFAVLVGLILTTTTIYRQTEFALARGLGAQDSKLIAFASVPCGGAFPEAVGKLSGVRAVSCATPHWLMGAGLSSPVTIGDRKSTFDVSPVDFGFFEFYGVRPLAGRLFSRVHGEDAVLADPNAKAQPTVIINETAARALGYADPRAAVGRPMAWSRQFEPGATPVEGRSQIVGVVPDQPADIRVAVRPTFYVVLPRDHTFMSIKLTGQDAPGTLRAVKAVWSRMGNRFPLNASLLSQHRQILYGDLIAQSEAVAVCAGLAILLAGVGLFALAAYMTERRTKEIGIRKAMGAGKWDVVRLLLWQFTVPVLCAVAVAAPVGFLAMHGWLSRFAYRVPLSAWTFAVAATAAVLIAWLTVAWQSYAAARAKPAGALQYE